MSEIIPKFMTVKETASRYPFSESSLRFHILNRKKNGMNNCIRRIGTRILINSADFEKWINGHKSKI